jgi:hypothetical protein
MVDPILPQLDPIDHAISVYRWRAAVIPELEDGDLSVTYDRVLDRRRRRAGSYAVCLPRPSSA